MYLGSTISLKHLSYAYASNSILIRRSELTFCEGMKHSMSELLASSVFIKFSM